MKWYKRNSTTFLLTTNFFSTQNSHHNSVEFTKFWNQTDWKYSIAVFKTKSHLSIYVDVLNFVIIATSLNKKHMNY